MFLLKPCKKNDRIKLPFPQLVSLLTGFLNHQPYVFLDEEGGVEGCNPTTEEVPSQRHPPKNGEMLVSPKKIKKMFNWRRIWQNNHGWFLFVVIFWGLMRKEMFKDCYVFFVERVFVVFFWKRLICFFFDSESKQQKTPKWAKLHWSTLRTLRWYYLKEFSHANGSTQGQEG